MEFRLNLSNVYLPIEGLFLFFWDRTNPLALHSRDFRVPAHRININADESFAPPNLTP